MTNMESPIIIKITPYKGMNDEVFEGKKTKISLFSDRLEYVIKFNQKARVTKANSEDDEIREVIAYSDEEGTINKDSIAGFIKYIETEYTEDLEPNIVNYVDICSTVNSLTFSVEDEASKNKLYKELHDWNYGTK